MKKIELIFPEGLDPSPALEARLRALVEPLFAEKVVVHGEATLMVPDIETRIAAAWKIIWMCEGDGVSALLRCSGDGIADGS